MTNRLTQLYSMVPPILNCKGHCHESCGPIAMTVAEWEHMGKPDVPHDEHDGYVYLPDRRTHILEGDNAPNCPLLDKENRCSVYDKRPTICRLWGSTDDLPCPWGCRPRKRMKEREGRHVLLMVRELSGAGTPKYLDAPDLEAFMSNRKSPAGELTGDGGG